PLRGRPRTRSWRSCSSSATAPRRSSRMQPVGANRRPRPSTGCAAPPTGWSCGARRRRRSSSGCAPSLCGCLRSTTSGCARRAVDELRTNPAAPPPVADPRLVGLGERLDQALAGAAQVGLRFEAALRARVDAGGSRTGYAATALRELAAREAELRRGAAEAGERAAAVDVELARLEAEQAAARRRFEDAGDEPAEGDDREALAERLVRLERRRETLGAVNPLAKQEYEEEKERLTELTAQREDLERSLAELEKLRNELSETVERRFDETFAAVQQHFADVAQTLFPGGEGRLRLSEPDEDGADDGS